jgi:hypothetical protein
MGPYLLTPIRFAGMPGTKNCHGMSVSALTKKFGGLEAAATALGYSTVQKSSMALLAATVF